MIRWLPLLCLLAAPALAQDWKLDPARSQVVFVIKQMNVPTEGRFKHFAVQANFDPAQPEGGQFRVDVASASIDTGSAEGDEEVKRPLWFDAKKYPYAQFVSKSMQRLADGRYNLQGELAIKGVRRALAVPVTLTRQGNGWRVSSQFPLKRSSFGIGGGDWNEVVADDLGVREIGRAHV
jgi:polyisoprenoid-binding protein YceI